MNTSIQQFADSHGIPLKTEQLLPAFTHPSFRAIEREAVTLEPFETLGDAVLDLLTVEYFYRAHNHSQPSELTLQRSMMVNNQTLSGLGSELELEGLIRCGESYTIEPSDIANVVEAIFGIVYLYLGLEACRVLLMGWWDKFSEISKQVGIDQGRDTYYNPVGMLQEILQKQGLDIPSYRVIEQRGPDHQPEFTVRVTLHTQHGTLSETATGSSKKKARIAAAAIMLEAIEHEGLNPEVER